jgi:hypothetical protein
MEEFRGFVNEKRQDRGGAGLEKGESSGVFSKRFQREEFVPREKTVRSNDIPGDSGG